MGSQLFGKNLSPVVIAALSEKASQMSAPALNTELAVTLFQHKLFTLQRAEGFPFRCSRHHAKGAVCWKALPFLSGPTPVLQRGLPGTVLVGRVAFCNSGVSPGLVSAVGYLSPPLMLFPATPCFLCLLPQLCKRHRNPLAGS